MSSPQGVKGHGSLRKRPGKGAGLHNAWIRRYAEFGPSRHPRTLMVAPSGVGEGKQFSGFSFGFVSDVAVYPNFILNVVPIAWPGTDSNRGTQLPTGICGSV